jgi:surfeit locus 1 family protein
LNVQFNQIAINPSALPLDPLPTTSVRRRRPRFLPTLATLVAIVLFTSAGEWQRGRMAQKAALRAQFDAAIAAAPMALPATMSDGAALRYRPVIVTGTFDATHQILIDNKVQDGRAGFHVVTPLELTDGRVVLVDRGWVAAGALRAQLPEALPPPGRVVLTGRINIPTTNYVELERDTPAGVVWQNLDPARFAQATRLAILPVVIEQTAPLDAADTLVRVWPEPDFGIERHRIYMVQWYLFAATALGLWLYFHVFRRGTANA